MQPCDMVGKTDFDFMPTDQEQKAACDYDKVMESGEPIIDHIEKLTTKDGDDKWLSVTKIP